MDQGLLAAPRLAHDQDQEAPRTREAVGREGTRETDVLGEGEGGREKVCSVTV